MSMGKVYGQDKNGNRVLNTNNRGGISACCNPDKLRSKSINPLFKNKIPVCIGIDKEAAIEEIKQQPFFKGVKNETM